jgi:hypothetical protein
MERVPKKGSGNSSSLNDSILENEPEYNAQDMSVMGLSDMVEVAQRQMKKQEDRIIKKMFKGSGKLKNSTINNQDDSSLSGGYVDLERS